MMPNRREFLVGSLGVVMAVPKLRNIGRSYPDILKSVPVLRMDHPNKNNRIYPLKVVKKALDGLHGGTVMGTMNPLTTSVIRLSEVAFQADNFHMVNGSFGPILHCDIKVQWSTPLCRLFKEMVEKEPEKFEYRTTGVGSGIVDDVGVYTLREFHLTSITAIPYGRGS